MRHGKSHPFNTRRRIIEAASDTFRRRGIHASGLVPLMEAAGLTHGAFYGHFPSKEALVRESIVDALSRRLIALKAAIGRDGDGFEDEARHYLSPEYRDRPAQDCVVATLAPEIAREPIGTRAAIERRIDAIFQLLADRLPRCRGASRRREAIALYALMAGTLQLSRVTASPGLSAEILESGLELILDRLRPDSTSNKKPPCP